MASIITATTTSGLTQSADNSGVLQLASGAGNLVTVPSVTGTVMVSGNMPAFRGTQSTAVSCSTNTNTKITIDTKTFDTANCFNTATNRFTPNVAGYYQVNASITFFSYAAQYTNLMLFKNGSAVGGFGSGYSSINGIASFNVTDLVFCNGTTDYLELYVIQGNTTMNANNGVFSIAMVRAA